MASQEGQQIDTLPVQAYGLDGETLRKISVDADGKVKVSGIDLSGYVPYSGATGAVNLGSQNLTTTGIGTFGQVITDLITSKTDSDVTIDLGPAENKIHLHPGYSSGDNYVILYSESDDSGSPQIFPSMDNAGQLGITSNRWNKYYGVDGDFENDILYGNILKSANDRLNITNGGADGFFSIVSTDATPLKGVQFGGSAFNVAGNYPIVGYQNKAARGSTFTSESFRLDPSTGHITTIGDIVSDDNFNWDASEKLLTASSDLVTIGDVPSGSGSATQVTGYDMEAFDYYYTFNVYAYRIVDGQKIFSENSESITFQDDESTNFYSIYLTWTAVADAAGYLVVVDYDDYHGYYGDKYFYTSSNATVYLYDENMVFAPVSLLSGTPVVTPNSRYKNIMDVDGYIDATGFIGDGSGITGNYTYFPIWTEESSDLYANNDGNGTGWIFSFGNGATKNYGVVMPYAGQILSMSMSAYASGTTAARVQISINHVAQGTSYQVNSPGYANGVSKSTFTTPLSFNAGDRLSFVCVQTGSSTENVVMTMWVKMQVP